MTTAEKEEKNHHLWRNESIHPRRTYNRNNEVDPLNPFYDEDVETSQREMPTGFGREKGRDNKNLFVHRNSYSDDDDGCIIS